jgi:lipopolysaccharide export system permease protein
VRSELVALSALGISPWRIGGSGMALLVGLSLPLAMVGETLAPWAETQGQAIKLQAMHQQVALAGGGSLWAREGREYFNARGGVRRDEGGTSVLEFTDVKVYAFDAEGRLQWLQTAAKAEYRDGEGWRLREVRRTVFGASSATLETFAEQAWDTDLEPGAIEAGVLRPRYQSAATLATQMDQLRRNGLDVRSLQSAYWGRWFYPLSLLALLVAALPVAFTQQRSGGFGKRLFVGIVFALLMRIVQPMLVSLAEAYHWDIRLAYALPVILLVAFGVVQMRRRT